MSRFINVANVFIFTLTFSFRSHEFEYIYALLFLSSRLMNVTEPGLFCRLMLRTSPFFPMHIFICIFIRTKLFRMCFIAECRRNFYIYIGHKILLYSCKQWKKANVLIIMKNENVKNFNYRFWYSWIMLQNEWIFLPIMWILYRKFPGKRNNIQVNS